MLVAKVTNWKSAVLTSLLILVFTLNFAGCSPGSKATPLPSAPPTSAPASAPAVKPAATPPSLGIPGALTLGKAVSAVTMPVPTSGGKIAVTEAGSPLTGLEINVPSGAHAADVQYKLSYSTIESNTFGSTVNPVSPLITVDNGEKLSEEFINVKVPVKIPAGHFAMGFIYDEKTKKLEGMPLVSRDASSVTVSTRHFSSFFVSSIDELLLKKDIDSGFKPGRDDWQFTNFGSFIADGGHCAGQSVTALWYYVTKPDGPGVSLWGKYDNNGDKPATPDFQDDDSQAYRFVSAVHQDINWNSFGNKFWTNVAGQNDAATWKLFAYSMQVTGEPQEVGIFSKAGGGHDMICYRITDKALYIADPNYPGNPDRRIEYADGKFKPYNSGANAEEIAAGNGQAYETIEYCAKTTTVDWNLLAKEWEAFKAKFAGIGSFPDSKWAYRDEKGVVQALTDGYVSPTKTITLSVLSANPEVAYFRVFRDGIQVKSVSPATFALSPGVNRLGIEILGAVQKVDKDKKPYTTYKFVDFKYFNINFTGLVIDPQTLTGETNKEYSFTAKMDKMPPNVKLEWAVDGAVKAGFSSTNFATTFTTEGAHTVSVRLLDAANKEVATDKASITIGKANISVTIDPKTLDNPVINKMYTFTATAVNAPDKAKYVWSVNNYVQAGSNTATFENLFPADGDYTITTSLQDAAGKELATASVKIVVKTIVNLLPILQQSTSLESNILVAATLGVTWDYKTGSTTVKRQLGNWFMKVTNLKWNGTSFSGTFSDPAFYITADVTGTVSPDALTLVSMTVNQVSAARSGNGGSTLSYQLTNVPLMWKENNGGKYPASGSGFGTLQTFFTGPGLDKYVKITKWSDKSSLGVNMSITETDWTARDNNLTFAFRK